MINWNAPIGFAHMVETTLKVLDDNYLFDDTRCVVIKVSAPGLNDSVIIRQHHDGHTPSVLLNSSRFANQIIYNIPVVERGFHPVFDHTFARGLISLGFAKSEYPRAKDFVEIIRQDRKIVDIKLHKR